MEVNFGRSAPFSLGVEEEFQLLSPESFELVSRYDEVAEAAGAVHRPATSRSGSQRVRKTWSGRPFSAISR